jgi:hypothetical protein
MIGEYNGVSVKAQPYLGPAEISGGMYHGASCESSVGSPLNSNVRREETAQTRFSIVNNFDRASVISVVKTAIFTTHIHTPSMTRCSRQQ